jgi:hypothetical protein
MQELSDTIKGPKQRITGIEGGEEVQTKGIHDIFNKTITENFLNLEKVLPIQVWDAAGHQTDLTKIEPTHSILKQQADRTEKEY